MNNIPQEIAFQIVDYLSLKELGILSRTCRQLYHFIHVVYINDMVRERFSPELLESSNMDALEMLNYLDNEQGRLSCGDHQIAWIDSNSQLHFWNQEGYKLFPSLTQSVLSVSCGRMHTIFLTADFQAYGFGENNQGQLGVGDYEPRQFPTQIPLPAAREVKSISCAGDCSLILTKKSPRELYICGYFPAVIASLMSEDKTIPKRVKLPQLNPNESIEQICLGGKHLLVSTNSNRLYSLGDPECIGRRNGFIDIFEGVDMRYFPEKSKILKISAGFEHSLVLMSDGSVFSFGKSSNGELGLPRFQDAMIPQQIKDVPPAISVAAGKSHSIVIVPSGRKNKMYTFGLATHGQLGYACSFWSSCQPRESQFPHRRKSINLAAGSSDFSVFASPYGQKLSIFGRFGSSDDSATEEPSKNFSTIFVN